MGAIEVIRGNSPAERIEFQYNPDTISRTLTPKYGKSGNAEAFRLEGEPEEVITVEIEFDATDQLEQIGTAIMRARNEEQQSNQTQISVEEPKPEEDFFGVSPQLAALESIIYPTSEQISNNADLAKQGKMEIVPPIGPLVMFAFGERMVLPVKITQYQIQEQSYDSRLNPILAKVTITMSVLTYTDLKQLQRATTANHSIKEETANIYWGT
jgi:hypothetical protein